MNDMISLNENGIIGMLRAREMIRGKISVKQNCAIVEKTNNGFSIRSVEPHEMGDVPILGEINYEHCKKTLDS